MSGITYNRKMDVLGAVEFEINKGLRKQWFGGGNYESRTLFVCIGINALKKHMEIEDRCLSVFITEAPSKYSWDFTKGHDIWIRPCGFVKRSIIRELTDQVKPYAARVLYFSSEGVKWSI